MASLCQVCLRTNPAEAQYCYFDGRLLASDRAQGPLKLGLAPFPTPFYFPDGQPCANFNQLMLTCDFRWEEARNLLHDGIWPTFFGNMGRLDLALAAKQAAAEPDPDQGLSQLLEKLPADADCRQPPRLALDSAEEHLGQLTPGSDLGFELVIRNKGMFLLRGVVASNCDWIVFDDRSGPSQKMFQTRKICAIPVRVLGHKLRAGLKPLQAEIVIESNGGSIKVPVTAEIPIRPFPRGLSSSDALAGARSPREIALKAKENPNEAAKLFALGAVKAWYESNGWTYPIEGSEGSGKGAVQQFFEALGLTKPPRLEISATSLTVEGNTGERHARRLMVRTDEAKPVYAHVSCRCDWVKVKPIKYLGNKVEITFEITIPPLPGETVVALVTIQGNGKQQFVVPMSVMVAEGPIPVVVPVEDDEDDEDEDENDESWGDWFSRLWR